MLGGLRLSSLPIIARNAGSEAPRPRDASPAQIALFPLLDDPRTLQGCCSACCRRDAGE